MSYINSRQKLFWHVDEIKQIRDTGTTNAPVNVEIDLSNRCSHGCSWCLTRNAILDIMGRGKCSIADVRPGDFVLAYNEDSCVTEWAKVYAVSERQVDKVIYRIVVGGTSIEATGNHLVYTRRGWIEARHLTIYDEVGYVSEIVRMRLRSTSEDKGVKILSGSWADGGIAQGEQRQNESQQPHEESRSFSEAVGDLESARVEQSCIPKIKGTPRQRRNYSARFNDARNYRGESATHENEQSHEKPRGCGCGGKETLSVGIDRGCGGTNASVVAGRKLPSGASSADERQQSHDGYGDTREVVIQDPFAPDAIQVGAMVQPVLREIPVSCLVHGDGRILGKWSESRFQDTRSEASDRGDGRLFSQASSANSGELCFADNRALSGERVFLPSGDVARQTTKQDHAVTGKSSFGDSGISEGRQEFGLEFHKVESITPVQMGVMVHNLETSTGTYFASNLLVHNCHFAYTHTRGPLVGRRDKPAGHIDGGDLMDFSFAIGMLTQLKKEGIKSVTWTGGGEPTLYPFFNEIVYTADSLGLEQGLYTHGGHIDQERAALLKEKLTFVYVSLDECTAEDFAKSKGVNRFANVLSGIKNLVDAKGSATIGIGFLLHTGNYSKADDMVTLGKSLGVDYMQFRPIINYEQDAPGQLVEDIQWVNGAINNLRKYAGDKQIVTDTWRFEMYRDWNGHGYKTCNWSALQTVITPNGKVWRCTNKREHPDALLGDLTVESFADLWKRSGGACKVNDKCRVMCRGHIANLTLDSIISEPNHPNFI